MSTDLRSKVIRLAHANPALRADLLPLLKQAATQKQALDIKKMLAVLFAGVEPHVKNYPHFIRVLAEDLGEWWTHWENMISWQGGKYYNVEMTSDFTQGGMTHRQTLESPAEYEEYDYSVLHSFEVAVECHLSLRRWPKMMALRHHTLITDLDGFVEALSEMVDNQRTAKVLGKYLLMVIRMHLVSWGTIDIGGNYYPFVEQYAKDLAEELSDKGSSYQEIVDNKVTDDKGAFKIVGDGIDFLIPRVSIRVDVSPPPLPEPDFDLPDPSDY